MTTLMRNILTAALALLPPATLALLPAVALAQSPAATYPSKPVRIMVSYGAGGPTDILARQLAYQLGAKYKQSMIVENRPGAGQLTGADALAKAPADGYTLLAAIGPTLCYESLLNKDAPLNTTRDILPFATVAGAGLFMAVNTSKVPAKTLPEFLAFVKSHPGQISWGTAGAPLVEIEALRDKGGLNWVNVNYKSGAAAMQALIAGEVDGYTPDVNQVAPPMKEGRVRALGYGDLQRHPLLPEVPTVAESNIGVPDFTLLVWLGMFAHPDVPGDILAKLNADINEASSAPEAVARITPMGWRPMPNSIASIRKQAQASNELVASLLAKGVKLR